MNMKEREESLEDIAKEYLKLIGPHIKQAVTHGAIFGSLHMDTANEVRRELLRQVLESPEFKGGYYNGGFHAMAEEEWANQMLTLQSICLPNGNKLIPNFDEKSAREGFLCGVSFMHKIALERLKQIFEDKK